MAINLACIPIIYFFYPETRNRTLEDMEALFNKNAAESVSSLNDPVQDPEKHPNLASKEV